jgi:hypothetical protein
VPTGFYHCTHCEVTWRELGIGQKVHREQLDAGLPDDLAQEYRRLSAWVSAVLDRYGADVVVRVVDPASLEGFYKSLRYGVRRYPAIVIDGRKKVIGGDYEQATALLAEQVAAGASAGQKGG